MDIAVLTDFIKSGIGKSFCMKLRNGHEIQVCGVRLVSGVTRTGAHAFYKAYGYTGSKEQKNFKNVCLVS